MKSSRSISMVELNNLPITSSREFLDDAGEVDGAQLLDTCQRKCQFGFLDLDQEYQVPLDDLPEAKDGFLPSVITQDDSSRSEDDEILVNTSSHRHQFDRFDMEQEYQVPIYNPSRDGPSTSSKPMSKLAGIEKQCHEERQKIKKPKKVGFMKKSLSMLSLLPSQRQRRRTSSITASFDDSIVEDNIISSRTPRPVSILKKSNSMIHLLSNEDNINSARSSHPDSILKKSSSMMHLSANEDTSNTSATSVCSKASSSSASKMKRVASFSTIEIREYNLTLGDNPGGLRGPPVSLDWDHNKHLTQTVKIEVYEDTRGPRRSKSEMYMDSGFRSFMLMKENGYSMKEIRKAGNDAAQIRKSRAKANRRL